MYELKIAHAPYHTCMPSLVTSQWVLALKLSGIYKWISPIPEVVIQWS
jgi:hypothetical protein